MERTVTVPVFVMVTGTIGIGQYGGGVEGNFAVDGLICRLATGAGGPPDTGATGRTHPAVKRPIASAAMAIPVRTFRAVCILRSFVPATRRRAVNWYRQGGARSLSTAMCGLRRSSRVEQAFERAHHVRRLTLVPGRRAGRALCRGGAP